MNRILDHLSQNWIKYAFETLVVVVGILVAFSLSNWNEDRKAAAEEQVVLKLLHDDFKNILAYSKQLIDYETDDQKILTIALRSKKDVDSLFMARAEIDVVRTIFWDFQHGAPVFRAYMDIKGSDRSSIIQSQELRTELTVLEEKIHELDYLLEDRRTVHTLRIDAISAEQLNYLYLIENAEPNIEFGDKTNYREMLQDQFIRNLIGIKLQLGSNVLENRVVLHEQINRVIKAIEKELK